jgi:hypothetical protein
MSIKGPSRIDASSEICAAGTKPKNALPFNWKKNKTKKYISTLKKKPLIPYLCTTNLLVFMLIIIQL